MSNRKPTLSSKELGSLRVALADAEIYALTLLEAHWDDFRKEYYDHDNVRNCKMKIQEFKRLSKKLQKMMSESKRKP
jgi:hypothetical protein